MIASRLFGSVVTTAFLYSCALVLGTDAAPSSYLRETAADRSQQQQQQHRRQQEEEEHDDESSDNILYLPITIHTLPTAWGATDYSGFRDTTSAHKGNCGGGPVDSKDTDDEVCVARDGACAVGWTKTGEWVDYRISVPEGDNEDNDVEYDVTLRVSSKSRSKELSLSVNGQSHTFDEMPGFGFDDYVDVVWTNVALSSATVYDLRVDFVTGGVNVCAISVEESSSPSDVVALDEPEEEFEIVEEELEDEESEDEEEELEEEESESEQSEDEEEELEEEESESEQLEDEEDELEGEEEREDKDEEEELQEEDEEESDSEELENEEESEEVTEPLEEEEDSESENTEEEEEMEDEEESVSEDMEDKVAEDEAPSESAPESADEEEEFDGDGRRTLGPVRLRMWWQLGYVWQEETFERLWCLECDTVGECQDGDMARVRVCDNTTMPLDRNTIFEIEETEEEGEVIIREISSDMCLTTEDFLEDKSENTKLRPCDGREGQTWETRGFGDFFDDDRFEIHPVGYDQYCLTTHHFPKDAENARVERCGLARDDTASYWTPYYL